LLAGREGSAGDRSPEPEIVGRIGRSRSRRRRRRRRRSFDGREREKCEVFASVYREKKN